MKAMYIDYRIMTRTFFDCRNNSHLYIKQKIRKTKQKPFTDIKKQTIILTFKLKKIFAI